MRAPQRAGFEFLRQRASHITMVNRSTGQTVPVPVHGSRPLRPGTLRAIIRDAGLTVAEFVRLLD
jgi:predicted RNA binding protein YcfA (HicA-like mRNA interferase family)